MKKNHRKLASSSPCAKRRRGHILDFLISFDREISQKHFTRNCQRILSRKIFIPSSESSAEKTSSPVDSNASSPQGPQKSLYYPKLYYRLVHVYPKQRQPQHLNKTFSEVWEVLLTPADTLLGRITSGSCETSNSGNNAV